MIKVWAAVALLIGLSVTAIPRTARAADTARYTHPGQRVRIEGARRLNMVCVGQGSPVVVLEAGLGDSSSTWADVQGALAATTRVCAYDRAGYGFSDAAPHPSTAENNAADLQRLLKAAGLTRAPIVLVAHSLGGLYATLFTAEHRLEIAGLVLVDPSFAEQNREIFLLSTPEQRAASDERLRGFMSLDRACLALARKHQLSEATTNPAHCLPTLPDPVLNAEARRQYARAKTQAAQLSEILSISSFKDDKISADSRAVDRASHDFGALPLIVLTRGNPTPPPAFFDRATQDRVDAAWKAGHDRLAAYSTIGKSVVVQKADHYIQRDQPKAVIDAVLEVVRAARGE